MLGRGSPRRGDREAGDQGENIAAPGEKSAAAVAGEEGRNAPIQTMLGPSAPAPAEGTSLAPDGTALLRTDEAGGAKPPARGSRLTGLGMAAYLFSPHGQGEQQVAAEQGLTLTPPGAKPGQLPLGAAAEQTLPGAALTPTEAEPLPESNNLRKPEADVFELNPRTERDQPVKDAPELQRQHLMEAIRQPVAEGKAPPPGPSLGLAAGLFLQARLAERKGSEALPPGGRDLDLTAEMQAAQAVARGVTGPDRAALALTAPERAQSQMVERVVQDVKWMLANDRNEVTIRLHPEHLGAMRLEVRHSDGLLRVEMTVDNQHARLLLESRLDELRQRLGQDSLNVDRFTVNVNVQEGNDWGGARQMAQGRQEAPYPAWLREPPAPREAVLAPAQRPIWGRAGVGLYA